MTYSNEEILGQLALDCYRVGGIKKWAKNHNCSYSSVSRMLKGAQPISAEIAKILGIKPLNLWVPIEPEENTAPE